MIAHDFNAIRLGHSRLETQTSVQNVHIPSATRGHTLKALRVVADRSGARAVGVDDAKRQRAQRRTNRVQHAAKGPRAQHSRRQRQRRERVTNAEHRNGEREIRKFTLRDANRRKPGDADRSDADQIAKQSILGQPSGDDGVEVLGSQPRGSRGVQRVEVGGERQLEIGDASIAQRCHRHLHQRSRH